MSSILISINACSSNSVKQQAEARPAYNMNLSKIVINKVRTPSLSNKLGIAPNYPEWRVWRKEAIDYVNDEFIKNLQKRLQDNNVFYFDRSDKESIQLHVQVNKVEMAGFYPYQVQSSINYSLVNSKKGKINFDVASSGSDGSLFGGKMEATEKTIDKNIKTFVTYLDANPKLQPYVELTSPESELTSWDQIMVGFQKSVLTAVDIAKSTTDAISDALSVSPGTEAFVYDMSNSWGTNGSLSPYGSQSSFGGSSISLTSSPHQPSQQNPSAPSIDKSSITPLWKCRFKCDRANQAGASVDEWMACTKSCTSTFNETPKKKSGGMISK